MFMCVQMAAVGLIPSLTGDRGLFRILFAMSVFSKDKEVPYKTHVGNEKNFWACLLLLKRLQRGPAAVSAFEPKGCFLAGGIWQT